MGMSMEEMTWRAARSLAIDMHGSQMYGVWPYSWHLDDVFGILYNNGLGGNLLPAAYLHDSLEDTELSHVYLLDNFGLEVYNLVWACTGVGQTRRERNLSIYNKLVRFPKAKNLKIADRISNVHSGAKNERLYWPENDEFMVAVEGASPILLDMLNDEWRKWHAKKVAGW